LSGKTGSDLSAVKPTLLTQSRRGPLNKARRDDAAVVAGRIVWHHL